MNAVVKLSKRVVVEPGTVKKRVAWHNDGPSANVSSLSCLVDWITTGINYSRYRGGEGQVGEAKITIAGEVVRYLRTCGVTTARTPKDIMWKTGILESEYRTVADWLETTGSGIDDEGHLK